MNDPTLATMAVMGAIVVLALVYGIATSVRDSRAYHKRLRTAALVGRGRVVDLEEIPHSSSSLAEMRLLLDIQIPGQPDRSARVYHHCLPGSVPRQGEWVPVRIHPDHPQDIYIESTA